MSILGWSLLWGLACDSKNRAIKTPHAHHVPFMCQPSLHPQKPEARETPKTGIHFNAVQVTPEVAGSKSSEVGVLLSKGRMGEPKLKTKPMLEDVDFSCRRCGMLL